MSVVTQLPFEVWCLILKKLDDDLIQVFKLKTVSKYFYEVSAYVLNHIFRIKLPSLQTIKRYRIDLHLIHHSHKRRWFDLFFDSTTIQDIDIIYRFIRHFSTVVPKNWQPTHKNSINHLARYYLDSHPLFDVHPDCKRINFHSNCPHFFESEKGPVECVKLMNQFEDRTTFIQCFHGNQNYCLLFNKFNP